MVARPEASASFYSFSTRTVQFSSVPLDKQMQAVIWISDVFGAVLWKILPNLKWQRKKRNTKDAKNTGRQVTRVARFCKVVPDLSP